MKYCSKCKKVYPDDVECECTKEKTHSWDKTVTMHDLDCEPVCRCGSTEQLRYHEPYKFISCDRIDPSYCTCFKCEGKARIERERQESMKYLILDDYQGENKFCDDKNDVEEFLKYYVEDSDRDSGSIDGVLILKLEPIKSVKESDFKPQRVFKDDKFVNEQESNTHIVFWDEEMYRVEEVIVPEIEYDGDRSINW